MAIFWGARLWPGPCRGSVRPGVSSMIRIQASQHYLAAICLVLGMSACSLEKKDDVSEYREALPQKDAVALDGPETTQGQSGTTSGSAGLLADAPAGENL